MLKKEALLIVGGLSKPSKMPGMSIGLPAWECKTGSKLREVEGSVCSNYYAMKGCYIIYPAVKAAQYRRLAALKDARWIEAMVVLISGQSVFRWHDSGDLRDLKHLHQIVEVCKKTPDTKHWLPTKEKQVIKQFLKVGSFPDNLTVRVSSAMVNGLPLQGFLTSTVHTDKPIGFECVVPSQDGQCKTCRACWDRRISNVSYHQH